MTTISAAIITRNEESNIGRCLKSLHWVEDVVVVDAESTDRTREIAGQHGARVLIQPWLGVGRQYQFAISMTRSEWVLVVDADEEVPAELRDEIRAALEGNPDPAAFWIPRINFALGTWLRWGGWRESVIRLLDKSRVTYLPLNHPKQEIDGSTGRLKNPLRHYMATDFAAWWTRSFTLARIEADTAFAEGRRFSGLRILGGFWKFFRRYVFKLGFLHGWAGLLVCLQRFLYVAVQQASLLELQLGIREPVADPTRSVFK